MAVIYTGVVTSLGGRDGHVRSSDGLLDLDLRRPPDSGGTNPEQLFAAAYGACFSGAFRLAARNASIALKEVAITVSATLNASETKEFDISVTLHASAEGLTKDQSWDLMQTAHAICPYSRAIRGNVEVSLSAGEFAAR